MAHNPKLNVYIIGLKPKKQDENKTFRDFLKKNIPLSLIYQIIVSWNIFLVLIFHSIGSDVLMERYRCFK